MSDPRIIRFLDKPRQIEDRQASQMLADKRTRLRVKITKAASACVTANRRLAELQTMMQNLEMEDQ